MSEKTPLAEAEPDSLSELFSRDPLKLQQQDLAKIVEELRRMRTQWVLAESKPKKASKLATAKPDLDLSDLEL